MEPSAEWSWSPRRGSGKCPGASRRPSRPGTPKPRKSTAKMSPCTGGSGSCFRAPGLEPSRALRARSGSSPGQGGAGRSWTTISSTGARRHLRSFWGVPHALSTGCWRHLLGASWGGRLRVPWGHRFCHLKPSLAVLAAWRPDLRPPEARLRQSGSLPGASWKQSWAILKPLGRLLRAF